MSEDMSERMSEDVSERTSQDMSEDMSERMSEDIEDMSERMSEDMSERMSKDMSERMSEDMSERMSKDMSERMSEDMSDKTNNFSIGNAAKQMLRHLMWRTAANTCGSTFRVQASEFGLAAMSELVVEPPATIFIGTSSRFAKGVGYVWRYVLTTVGPERIYVCMDPTSTLHAGDCMFIVPEVVDGTLWHVVYAGRAVPNEEGRQELEQRAAVFRTLASFWEVGVHEWQTNAVPSRASYTEEVQDSGKHLTSWFARAMRCSCRCVLTCMASWDSTAFWRGCLMHVVCVLLQALCIFGLNCFLAGLSDARRAMTFDRRKVIMDITFAAWCEVNIEFVEWLLCEAVDAMFCP